jgi:hypothetical protein
MPNRGEPPRGRDGDYPRFNGVIFRSLTIFRVSYQLIKMDSAFSNSHYPALIPLFEDQFPGWFNVMMLNRFTYQPVIDPCMPGQLSGRYNQN